MENNPDSLNIRLKVFMDYTGLNNSQFADKIGVPRPSFSQIITGRNKKVSNILLNMIHKEFKDLNMSWLMFGEGDMLLPSAGGKELGDSSVSSGATPTLYGYDIPMTDFIDDNLDNENLNFKDIHAATPKYEQEKAPILGSEKSHIIDYKEFRNVILQNIKDEIAIQLQKQQRRVVRITVFYDDNSYETFVPASSDKV